MARSAPATLPQRLRQRLATYRWRRVGVLAAISFVLSLSLILYLFGTSDRFLGRFTSAFFVGFCLLSVTFQVVIPFIGWATAHWFGKSWSGGSTPAPARRAAPPASRPPAARRSSTST
ncbi:hypothetical protein QMK33_16705 [Hymenobacter sp. H14-R3]|uniref:hypothetical protein n=1 Tax=Hymenobacter sp. H14-R3 TaxID=3046308 RepID=UPI0024BB71A0|nr:hypothetical protein [Hymenobacter sp. H14-R3]MDJ0366796.1 hypothetical protein [Hymenobacter sp. H14-R3]